MHLRSQRAAVRRSRRRRQLRAYRRRPGPTRLAHARRRERERDPQSSTPPSDPEVAPASPGRGAASPGGGDRRADAPPPAGPAGRRRLNIPGIGKLPTWSVLGGVGLVLVLIIRNRSSSSTAAAAGTSTDPAGNVGVIDPATGYVYGSPEDTAGLATSAGSSTADTSGTVGGSVGDQVTNGPPFTSNAAWSQYAVSVLEHPATIPARCRPSSGSTSTGSASPRASRPTSTPRSRSRTTRRWPGPAASRRQSTCSAARPAAARGRRAAARARLAAVAVRSPLSRSTSTLRTPNG